MTIANHTLLGQRVLYTLSQADVDLIVTRRRQAGNATKTGNDPRPGEVYPAVIVRVWGSQLPPETEGRPEYEADSLWSAWRAEEASRHVNLQVFLDGNDSHWATSRTEFKPDDHGYMNGGADGEGEWVPDQRGHWVRA